MTDKRYISGRWIANSDPQMFSVIRKSSLDYFMGVFARVASRVDDWLFDLSQKDGPLVGAKHLEALRALRIARSPMERDFRRHFETAFDAMLDPATPTLGSSTLSLLDDDQIEVQLASEMVVEKVMGAHGPALDAIDKRFAVLVGVAKLEPQRNPLSSANIANAMQLAQREVSLPAETRVVLFKFFERELQQTLDRLLSEINARLVAAGILPELGNPRPAEVHAVETAPAKPVAVPSGDDSEMFDALVGMLHNWRPQQGAEGAAGVERHAQGIGGSGPEVRALFPNEMLSVLSLMQNQVPEAVRAAMGNPDVKLSLQLKQELLRGANRIGLDSEQVHISPEDEDAVDLVGMIFDVMFDERDFETNARDLMARCVVPYVKAAVLDRHMFVHKSHPARKLLNSLAEACEGNRGEGAQEREVLTKAEGVVDRLVADFNEDIAIFNLLEQELREYLDQYRRRVELSEKRAAEAQRGQERLEQAREIAGVELNRRLEGRTLPATLADFLTNHWAHHLSLIALREGAGSTQWNSAIAIADALLAMVPGEGAKSHSVAAAIHGIREPIENVLASSGISGNAAAEVVRGIIAQMDQLSAGTLASNAKRTAEFPAFVMPTASESSRINTLAVAVDNTSFDFNPEDLAAVKKLKVGAWVHLSSEDEKLHPAKLSWISPITSRLMFVNRRGVRVLVASAEELAHLKKEGRLQIREQENVFDQVIHRVMGKLRGDVR